jgi:hypothetical protein
MSENEDNLDQFELAFREAVSKRPTMPDTDALLADIEPQPAPARRRAAGASNEAPAPVVNSVIDPALLRQIIRDEIRIALTEVVAEIDYAPLAAQIAQLTKDLRVVMGENTQTFLEAVHGLQTDQSRGEMLFLLERILRRLGDSPPDHG